MINLENFNIEEYKTLDVPIDAEYIDIHKAMYDLGYKIYDTILSKKMHLWKHIYTNGKKYYIIKAANCKHTFIRFITLADITDLIERRNRYVKF